MAAVSRAARPMGGAFGAPGHRNHRVVRGASANKPGLVGFAKPPSKDRGLTKDHSISD
jgi:hypothetical protein